MGLFRWKRRFEVGTAADGVGEVDPVEAYLDVRSRVLALVREERGDVPVDSRVLALAMESRFPSSVSAIVGLADGTATLYFHDGRSMLGGGVDEGVVAAAQLWLQNGEESLAHLAAVTGDPPLPELRTSAFYAVTTDGAFAGSIPHAELNEHPLLPLWAKAEGVRREVVRWTLKGAPEAYEP